MVTGVLLLLRRCKILRRFHWLWREEKARTSELFELRSRLLYPPTFTSIAKQIEF